MNIPPYVPVLAAIPALLGGEWLVRRFAVLARYNIPAPVVGGLLIALLALAANLANWGAPKFQTGVTAPWWTWLVTTEPEWLAGPEKNVNQPFLVAFFTCIGLNASWSLVKKGSGYALLFLGVTALLAVSQNLLGVVLAKMMGEAPLLGLVCGSLTLTGGIGTALGFAPELEQAGLGQAAVVSVAAATFGLVVGGLVSGPLGGWLIQRNQLKSAAAAGVHLEAGHPGVSEIRTDLRNLWRRGKTGWGHLLLLFLCIKAGAWVSYFIQASGITFPIYMGAMILGLVVRNVADACGARWLKAEIVDTLGSVMLGLFLVIAMMSLNLIELAQSAVPMLVILGAQIVLMGLFGWFVTFPVLGRSYDAAVMVAGQSGFALGGTANAVASMRSLVANFGPSPRAFLIVPIVGGFLIDFINALNITVFLNLLK
jgi:ESS family glutamate:Na+ symporter